MDDGYSQADFSVPRLDEGGEMKPYSLYPAWQVALLLVFLWQIIIVTDIYKLYMRISLREIMVRNTYYIVVNIGTCAQTS